MIESARRCCVCKRYKGVGVEIHHIVPKAKGGEDSYENGIPLCFDCHCSAGHYNPDHPRGTKFSPDELKGHKDSWFEYVRKHPFELGEDAPDPKIVCRYYVTSDRETASKFLNFDEKSLIKTKYLLNTPNLKKQFQALDKAYGDDVQDNETDGYAEKFYESRKELIDEYPEFQGCQNVPLSERVLLEGKLTDPFARNLIAAGASAQQVASMQYFYEACGGSGWGIDYQTRKPYFVFAQIINISDEKIRMTSLNNQPFELNSLVESDVFDMSDVKNIYKLNDMELSRDENMSLFLGVIAGPIDYDPSSIQFEMTPEIDENDEGDTLVRICLNSEGVDSDFSTCGKIYIPKTMSFVKEDQELEVAFEDFRPDTLFLISREWLCGSCPHLFGVNKRTGDVRFVKTLFDKSGGKIVEEIIDCKEFSKIIVAEFDNEISEITSLNLDGKEFLIGRELRYGDSISFDVNDVEMAKMTGLYNSMIQYPQNYDQRRQKSSKFRAYEKELKSGLLSFEIMRL